MQLDFHMDSRNYQWYNTQKAMRSPYSGHAPYIKAVSDIRSHLEDLRCSIIRSTVSDNLICIAWYQLIQSIKPHIKAITITENDVLLNTANIWIDH